MAPEVLSSRVGPPSDVWAAGVMAYQLLSGRLPFDDRRTPDAPALSLVWKAILTEAPSFGGKTWADTSAGAQDFVKQLLNKDPSTRPTAKAALRHPWLAGDVGERYSGRPLRATVVQRVQRYAQAPALKRTIFELMAAEILKLAPSPTASPGSSQHGPSGDAGAALAAGVLSPPSPGLGDGVLLSPSGARVSTDSSSSFSMRRAKSAGNLLRVLRAQQAWEGVGGVAGSPALGGLGRSGLGVSPALGGLGRSGLGVSPALGRGGLGASPALGRGPLGTSPIPLVGSTGTPRGAATAHGASDYWRIMRAAATAAAATRASRPGGSTHGGDEYLRTVGRSDAERSEQRKAARVMLDTSAHGGDDYKRLVRAFSGRPPAGGDGRPSLDDASASARFALDVNT